MPIKSHLKKCKFDKKYDVKWRYFRRISTTQEYRDNVYAEEMKRGGGINFKVRRSSRSTLPSSWDDLPNSRGRSWKMIKKVRKQWMK